MTMAEAVGTPTKMHLVDLASGEDMEVHFNPEQLVEEVQVAYARQTVPGMSHQPLQYTNTNNHGVPLDLYAVGTSEAGRDRVDDLRRFLLSLCYPRGDAGTIDDGAPPRVLFVWPNVWSMTCVVTGLKGAATHFAQDGRIMRFVGTITLEEIRDVRLTSEDVRRQGTRRSASGGGVSGV